MRLRAFVFLLVLCSSLVLAQQRDELTFRFEQDPHQLKKDVDRVASLMSQGSVEDAFALSERLLRDPRIRDGLVELEKGRFVSLDRVLRERVRSLDPETQKIYDARTEVVADRLEEQGTRRALAKLLATVPGASRRGRVALRLAELEVEAGDVELAAARMEEALASPGLDERDAERARVALPSLYVLSGRRKDCADALARLEGDAETAARRLAASAAVAAEARRAEQQLGGTAIGQARWVFENPDYYVGDRAAFAAWSEPACDATCAYVQDGSHCYALDIETGKVVWRAALRDEGVFRAVYGPCRLVLSETRVACLPPTNDIVLLDRASGERVAVVPVSQLRALVGANETQDVVVEPLLAGDTLVVAVVLRDLAQDVLLLGLDASTGRLLWKTPIGQLPYESSSSPRPVLATGAGLVFLMPGWGSIAAVDPHTGSVAWLRRYQSLRDKARRVPVHRGRRVSTGVESPSMRPGYLALQRGLLVAAPPDAAWLSGLDPRSGETVWKTDGASGAVLAGHGPGVVEVDAMGVVSFVGKAREPRAQTPRGATVGCAVAVGDSVLIPLNARGELVRVELAKGFEREPPTVTLLGNMANLAASRGRVIAAGPGRVWRLGAPEAAPVLSLSLAGAAQALGDPSYAVRESCSRMLERVGDLALAVLDEAGRSHDLERAIRARGLASSIRAEGRRKRFHDIIAASRWPGDTIRVPYLVGKDWSRRASELDALRRGNEPRFLPIFEEMLDDPDEAVARIAAVSALAYGSRAGIELVAKMASSKLVPERRMAFDVLERRGDAEDVEIFAKGIRDEDFEVRRRALSGALEQGDARMAAPIVKAIADGVDLSKSTILDKASMFRIRPALAGPLLRKLVHDSDWNIRYNAVIRLKDVKDPEGRAGLVEALDDEQPGVREAAFSNLREAIEREDPPELPPGAMERLVAGTSRGFLDSVLAASGRLLDRGKVVRPATFATAANRSELTDAQRVASFLLLRRSVELAPVDSQDVAAIGSLCASAKPATRAKAHEVLLAAEGPGRGALLAAALDDADADTRAALEKKLGALGEEKRDLLLRDEKDPAVAKKLREAFERSRR